MVIAHTAGVTLVCHPGKSRNTLVFPYQVENRGSSEIYVMDALPVMDPATRKQQVNDQAVVVMLGPGDDAIVGKFIAPAPTDRRMAMPAVPLARRLAAGESFEGRLTIPEPLAEISPYFGDLPLRQYEVVEVKGLVFTIGFWVAGVDGMAALPVDYAPGLFTVVTRDTVGSAARVAQRFPTNRLQLFKRTDQFPRAIGDAWSGEADEGELLASAIRPPAA
jgi:hypothetical protein